MNLPIGLRFVLVDDDTGEDLDPVSRIFGTDLEELQRMIDVRAAVDNLPEGYSLEVRPVWLDSELLEVE